MLKIVGGEIAIDFGVCGGRRVGVAIAAVGEDAMHQARDAVADIAFDGGIRQRRQPHVGAAGVGGGDEVGQGVAEGAVEIKGDGADGHDCASS